MTGVVRRDGENDSYTSLNSEGQDGQRLKLATKASGQVGTYCMKGSLIGKQDVRMWKRKNKRKGGVLARLKQGV